MFFHPPAPLRWLYPEFVWRMPDDEKVLYLTFDDGPVPGPTEFVLETLARYRARATFFCIGDNIVKHARQFDRLAGAGHTIGNHTFHHLNGWKHGSKEYVANVAKCDALVGGSGLFRPPYGRIRRSQARLLRQYTIVMWDVLTHDYLRSISPGQCLDGSIRATRPGSIVVFHDSYKAEKNMKFVLPAYLDHFAGQGYTFHALPERGSIRHRNGR